MVTIRGQSRQQHRAQGGRAPGAGAGRGLEGEKVTGAGKMREEALPVTAGHLQGHVVHHRGLGAGFYNLILCLRDSGPFSKGACHLQCIFIF